MTPKQSFLFAANYYVLLPNYNNTLKFLIRIKRKYSPFHSECTNILILEVTGKYLRVIHGKRENINGLKNINQLTLLIA